MKKRGKIDLSIWDILFWLGLIILATWLVLKLSGVIQSPLWQDLLPTGGAIILILLSAWGKLTKIDNIEKDVRRINFKLEKFGESLTELKTEHNLIKQGRLKFSK